MLSLPLQVDRGFAPGHLQLDSHHKLPIDMVLACAVTVDDFPVGQALRHRYEPAALLCLERHLVDLFHHVVREAGAIAEDHVCVGPLEVKDVAEDDFKPRSSR